jgi:hypothetical protein
MGSPRVVERLQQPHTAAASLAARRVNGSPLKATRIACSLASTTLQLVHPLPLASACA